MWDQPAEAVYGLAPITWCVLLQHSKTYPAIGADTRHVDARCKVDRGGLRAWRGGGGVHRVDGGVAQHVLPTCFGPCTTHASPAPCQDTFHHIPVSSCRCVDRGLSVSCKGNCHPTVRLLVLLHRATSYHPSHHPLNTLPLNHCSFHTLAGPRIHPVQWRISMSPPSVMP